LKNGNGKSTASWTGTWVLCSKYYVFIPDLNEYRIFFHTSNNEVNACPPPGNCHWPRGKRLSDTACSKAYSCSRSSRTEEKTIRSLGTQIIDKN